MVRRISRQRGGLAALKLTKLFGIDDFPAAKDAGKVLIIIIYCYLIIIILKISSCQGILMHHGGCCLRQHTKVAVRLHIILDTQDNPPPKAT